MKTYIQDLIDQGDIHVDANQALSSNAQLQIYQNSFPKHNEGPNTSNTNHGPSNSNNQDNNTNNITYKNVPLNYETLITLIGHAELHMCL